VRWCKSVIGFLLRISTYNLQKPAGVAASQWRDSPVEAWQSLWVIGLQQILVKPSCRPGLSLDIGLSAPFPFQPIILHVSFLQTAKHPASPSSDSTCSCFRFLSQRELSTSSTPIGCLSLALSFHSSAPLLNYTCRPRSRSQHKSQPHVP
jgi:hypothetical protein